MNFNWSSHIKTLNDLPDIKMLWEKRFVSAVLKNIPRKEIKKVLEVGCSNGRWLRWFKKEYNCEVFGLDNNSEGFKDDGLINFKVGDCRKMHYQDNFFDLAFSLGLVEHFAKEDKEAILKEQARALRPGGYLICLAPLLSFFSFSFFYVKLNYDFRKGYKHFKTTQKELEKYFRKIDIKIIYSKTIGNIFESIIGIGKFNNLLKNKFCAKILATEILIIGKKNEK